MKQFDLLLPFLLGMVILRNKLIKNLNQADKCDYSTVVFFNGNAYLELQEGL